MQARQRPAVELPPEVELPLLLERRRGARRHLPAHKPEMLHLPLNAEAEAGGAACNSPRNSKRNDARTRPALPKTATRPIACLPECLAS